MIREEFREDLAQYNLQELQLIAATQADVYAPEEMRLILDEIDARKEAERERRKKRDTNDTLPCVLSLLLPLIGVVIGLIFMHTGDSANRETGKRCIVASFVSLILFSYIISGGISF